MDHEGIDHSGTDHSDHPHTHKLNELKNTSTSGGRSSLVPFITSPRGNPPPTHLSRVLHHNGGPNQYKSCVFLCCDFVEFIREAFAS